MQLNDNAIHLIFSVSLSLVLSTSLSEPTICKYKTFKPSRKYGKKFKTWLNSHLECIMLHSSSLILNLTVRDIAMFCSPVFIIMRNEQEKYTRVRRAKKKERKKCCTKKSERIFMNFSYFALTFSLLHNS